MSSQRPNSRNFGSEALWLQHHSFPNNVEHYGTLHVHQHHHAHHEPMRQHEAPNHGLNEVQHESVGVISLPRRSTHVVEQIYKVFCTRLTSLHTVFGTSFLINYGFTKVFITISFKITGSTFFHPKKNLFFAELNLKTTGSFLLFVYSENIETHLACLISITTFKAVKLQLLS
jgi:hypothetical protein